MKPSQCAGQLNHGVLLIGVSPDAWKVRNSWGPDWGLNGDILLEAGKNTCSLCNSASYAEVELR